MNAELTAAIKAFVHGEGEAGKPKRATIARFFRELLTHKALIFRGSALLAISTLATVASPRILGYFVDDILIARQRQYLPYYAALFFTIELVRFLATAGHTYLFTNAGQLLMQDLRVRLFSHLQRVPVAAFDRIPSGTFVTRMTNDVGALNEMFTAGVVSILEKLVVLAATIVGLLLLNFKLGVIISFVFVSLFVAGGVAAMLLHRCYIAMRIRLAEVNSYLIESFMGAALLKVFNAVTPRLSAFADRNNAYAESQFVPEKVLAYLHPGVGVVNAAAVAFLIVYGGHMVQSGEIGVGTLVTAFAYVLWLFWPIIIIIDRLNVFIAGMAAANRIFAALDLPLESTAAPPPALPPAALRGEIEFRNVAFAYHGGENVLHDFSLRINAGEKIAIVGPSGSGKSTLAKLLMRFYSPQSGSILLDGRPLNDYDLDDLRRTLGIVEQDIFLFAGSLQQNLALWRPPETTAGVRQHGLFAFVKNWEQQLQEQGSNLSAGERQLLSFGRTLAHRPKLWILDEASAQLDMGAQAELKRLVFEAAAGATLISIAHRLATITDYDRIVVLAKGCLIEQGTHRELLAAQGLYAKLYALQEQLGE